MVKNLSFLGLTPSNKPVEASEPVASAVNVPSPETSKPQTSPVKPGLGAFLKTGVASKPVPSTQLVPFVEPIMAETEQVESRGPENFKQNLLRLDSMVGDMMRIEVGDIGFVRQMVRDIMVDLKEYPEFDGIVREKDVHNIMKFIQASSSQASNQFALQAEKKEKAATKKRNVIKADISALLGPITTHKFDLTSLSSFNTDKIDPKK
jgi:hypothetical protein